MIFMFITILKFLFSAVMAASVFLPSLFSGSFSMSFTPRDSENILLNFASISDVHANDSSLRADLLALGLEDVSNDAVDALVISGDITDRGNPAQWESLKRSFAEHCTLDNIVLASGNHDTWTSDDVDATSEELFIKYNKEISGRDIDRMYYSTRINGYTFIVLGSEGDSTDAYFSDEQLLWLNSQMALASQDGKPIFVVCHQPINGSHGLPETWDRKDPQPEDGGMGDQSDQVESILKSYRNVFLISGHLHNGIGQKVTKQLFNYTSIESAGSFHSVNLPVYSYFNARGQMISGAGFQFEVYADKVIVRARNYSCSAWYPDYEYSIDLV